MFHQMTSYFIVMCALLGTTLAAIYIGDNQRIDGMIRSGPFEDVVIGGRPNYGSQPNINRYPTNGRSGNGIYVGNGNTIRGTVQSDLPPGANLNIGGLLSNLPGGGSIRSNYQPPNNYNRYNSYPSNRGGPGIVIGNGNRLRGGISAPLY